MDSAKRAGYGGFWQERLPDSELPRPAPAVALRTRATGSRYLDRSVTSEPGDQGAGQRRREGHGVTDDSAFKKQVRSRMAATGENYTTARRAVIARHNPGQPPMVLRVYLNQYVDLELTGDMAWAYAAADEQDQRDMANRLIADQIEADGSWESHVTAHSKIVTAEELWTEAEDAAIRGAVQRGVERAIGVSAVEVDRTQGRVRVSIRAARPIVLVGPRGAEADRLRSELMELTGKRVQLDIREALDLRDAQQNAASGHPADHEGP